MTMQDLITVTSKHNQNEYMQNLKWQIVIIKENKHSQAKLMVRTSFVPITLTNSSLAQFARALVYR